MLYWLPVEALGRVARHYEKGARIYGRDNWQKGIPAWRCLASAARHLYQHIKGDRSEDHLSAVVFNVLCVIQYEEVGPSEALQLYEGEQIDDSN